MEVWIDSVGKLAPACIALLVLFTTWGQNRRLNLVSVRAAAVEDQKLRLALLDRRQIAIEKVRKAAGAYWVNGKLTADETAEVAEALRIAELAFQDEERAAVDKLLSKLWDLHIWNGRLSRYIDSRTEKGQQQYERACAEVDQLEMYLIENLTPLLKQLVSAARITIPKELDRQRTILGRR